MGLDPESLLPKKHAPEGGCCPRHPKVEHSTDLSILEYPPEIREVADKVKKAKKGKQYYRSPEAQALWKEFYDAFKAFHDYQYTGPFMPETKMIDNLLKTPGIDGAFVRRMIEYLFDDCKGYWRGDIVSVGTLCYSRSRNAIVDNLRRQEQVKQNKAEEAEDEWYKLGGFNK